MNKVPSKGGTAAFNSSLLDKNNITNFMVVSYLNKVKHFIYAWDFPFGNGLSDKFYGFLEFEFCKLKKKKKEWRKEGRKEGELFVQMPKVARDDCN